MRYLKSRRECMQDHPAGSAPWEAEISPLRRAECTGTPLVDEFMSALEEVERCRRVFGAGAVLDTELAKLAIARKALIRSWSGHAP